MARRSDLSPLMFAQAHKVFVAKEEAIPVVVAVAPVETGRPGYVDHRRWRTRILDVVTRRYMDEFESYLPTKTRKLKGKIRPLSTRVPDITIPESVLQIEAQHTKKNIQAQLALSGQAQLALSGQKAQKSKPKITTKAGPKSVANSTKAPSVSKKAPAVSVKAPSVASVLPDSPAKDRFAKENYDAEIRRDLDDIAEVIKVIEQIAV